MYFARLTPTCRVFFDLFQLSVKKLIEYTVQFHNYHHLQSDQNVHASMEVGVYLWKNILQQLHHQQLTSLHFWLEKWKGLLSVN